MNRLPRRNALSRLLFRTVITCRKLFPKGTSASFGKSCPTHRPTIERIYVINLDRQTSRWDDICRELRHIKDRSGCDLLDLTERFAAVDAERLTEDPHEDADVDPIYTLRDQLLVEPQPLSLPATFELDAPIRMSRPEVAVARSHIQLWRRIASADANYSLVLEDDIWFRSGFAKQMDLTWRDLHAHHGADPDFDILYLSYEEVKGGARKTLLSSNLFRPDRGLWHLSGYVVSRRGASNLLKLLPCRGPVDLWLNHFLGSLDVRAARSSIISQRPDLTSTNSYSILPALTKIGAITSEGAALFSIRPRETPVFAFGYEGSGLASLAMALSMLGYRCCSDLASLPAREHEALLKRGAHRVFDAYVNVGSLEDQIRQIRRSYPEAKFVICADSRRDAGTASHAVLDLLEGSDCVFLSPSASDKWQILCQHLKCAPPACPFRRSPRRVSDLCSSIPPLRSTR